MLFRKAVLKSVEFDVPIISVGNLSIGGSGKTPMVKYLINTLGGEFTIGVLSRGYGRRTKGFVEVLANKLPRETGDEPLEIKRNFPQLDVAVCEDRVLGVAELLSSNAEINLIILDDAFQHQYVKPKLSVLLSPYQSPYFKDFVMPMGRLREFRHNVNRADVVVFTKSSGNPTELNPKTDKPVFYSSIAYQALEHKLGMEGNVQNQCVAVSGLASNELFQKEVKRLCPGADCLGFSDHHFYTKKDVERIKAAAINNAQTVITTEKDWVKLEPLLHNADLSIYVLPVGMILHNEKEFKRMVKEKLSH